MDLHYKSAPELAHLDAILCGLKACFGDPMQTQKAEVEVRNVIWENRPMAESSETSGRSQGS